MKKKNVIISLMSILFSYLFYKEGLGINVCLIDLLLLLAFLVYKPFLIKSKTWLLMGTATLFSGLSVFLYGNLLANLLNFTSLLILLNLTFNLRLNLLFNLINSMWTFITAFVFTASDWIEKITNTEQGRIKKQKKAILYILPIGITLLFLGMYKSSNAIFSNFLNQINFDWISWSWIGFTCIGAYLFISIFNPNPIKFFDKIDPLNDYNIIKKESNDFTIFGRKFNVLEEFSSAKLLFILLNTLIFLVNILDAQFIFISPVLPEGISHAEFIHQGVGMLVISILISIIIILFYFRGNLNFIKANKIVKNLALLWIIQNLMMLVFVGFKNNMYICSYGLTYKRIGIYIYIVLCAIGLITTIYKIIKLKKNMLLVRINSWTFYIVFLVSGFIPWDQMIVQFNQNPNLEIDLYYLSSLSDQTIPALKKYSLKLKDKRKKAILDRLIEGKEIEFLEEQNQIKSWKSSIYFNQITLKQLQK